MSKVLATLSTPLPVLVVAGTAAAGARTRPNTEKTTALFIVAYEDAGQIRGVLGANRSDDCKPRMAPHRLLISLDPFPTDPLFAIFLKPMKSNIWKKRSYRPGSCFLIPCLICLPPSIIRCLGLLQHEGCSATLSPIMLFVLLRRCTTESQHRYVILTICLPL